MSLETKLKEIEDRANAATGEPWVVNVDDGWPIGSFSTGNSGEDGKDYTVWTTPMPSSELNGDAKDDAEFIAHARSDIPKLLAVIKLLIDKANEITIKHCEEILNDME